MNGTCTCPPTMSLLLVGIEAAGGFTWRHCASEVSGK
jgi:hypothetical protein